MSTQNEQPLINWWAEGDTPVHADSQVDYLVDARLNLAHHVPPFSHGTQVHLHCVLGDDPPDGTGAWTRPACRTRRQSGTGGAPG